MQLGGSAMARPGGDGSRVEGYQTTWAEDGEVRYTWAGPAGPPYSCDGPWPKVNLGTYRAD